MAASALYLAIDADGDVMTVPAGIYTSMADSIDCGIDAVEWAMKAAELGAGEILLTSMDCDGTKGADMT